MIINKDSGQLLTIKKNNKTDTNTYYRDDHVVKQMKNASVGIYHHHQKKKTTDKS